MFNSKFIGKWAWESQDAQKRSIEFSDDHGRLAYRITDNGINAWTPKALEVEKVDGGCFFTNNWMGENGDAMFLYEVRDRTGEAENVNTFINVQEWRIISDTSLNQVNRGFTFDRKENAWKEFREELLLRKLS